MKISPIPRRIAYHAEGSLAELTRVFSRGALSVGEETKAFETETAAALGAGRAVAVPSARYALRVLLESLALPAGGEVILPAYTDPSMPEAVIRAGLKPVFVDVRPADDNMDERGTAAKVTDRTCAIIATHIFGNPCEIGPISELASKRGLVLIEDLSHSVGAKYAGKCVGTFGAAGICTFNSSKFFNTFGGGMILTNDASLADKVSAARDKLPAQSATGLLKSAALSFGIAAATSPLLYPALVYPVQNMMNRRKRDLYSFYKKTYSVWKNTPREVAYSDLQSRLGRRILKNLDENHQRRVDRSMRLDAALMPEIERVRVVPPGEGIYWLFIIRAGADSASADRLQRRLLASGIDTCRGFLPHAAALYEPAEKYPNTLSAVETSLQLPNHPHLTDAQIDAIAATVNDLWEK